MVTRSEIRELKAEINPVLFYERELNISLGSKSRPRKWLVAGLCPFHADTRAGSFFINSETGMFICFACDAKGDYFEFLRRARGLGFMAAVEYLRSK